jgi:16S rRNA C967 or C1407 C5-methylase (RsmB/RsmF family)/NOL1/NOP2/fmu family ribosome biogenesis protein
MSERFPVAFEQAMQQRLGKEWLAFAESIQRPSPVSIRSNPRKNFSGTGLEPVPWSTTGFYLKERPVFTLDPLLHAGAYYVQEASSMFVEFAFRNAVSKDQTLKVLDLCGAPGGKSTLIASLISSESLLVANEVIRSRAGILAENLQKWGSDNVVVTNNDPEDFQQLNGFFDVMVVDAPCSGEGLFRKDPDAMKEWSEENVDLCSKRQRRILADVWPALKEDGILIYSTCTYNGILIYSTCTYNVLENEENLQWIASENDVEFISLPVDPSWGVEVVDDGKIKGYRFYPHKVNGEGFFLSVIRKKEKEDEIRIKAPKNGFATPTKKILETVQSWVMAPEEKSFIQRNDVLQFFPASLRNEIEFISKQLKIVIAGTFMATVKHDKVIPEHAMALSTFLNQANFSLHEVTLENALKYLRKETLPADGSILGFSLITYQNTPLGWVNVLSNRINNLYPAEWRIRMK